MVSEVPEHRQIRSATVLGAGNGGKAVAADLAFQGLEVRLFEWQEYAANLDELSSEPVIEAAGVLAGSAELSMATTDLAEAIDRADLIVVCVQGLAHARLAHELAPLIWDGAILLLNPGSTGGALEFRRIFGEHSIDKYVLLCETGTLTHCARTTGPRSVNIGLRVQHVAFAALPGAATESLHANLRFHFPGLQPRTDVLEVALCNGNPVIHPAIMLANAGAIEARGSEHRFYAEGVTPAVASIIQAVDSERLALGAALGYELLTEPAMSVQQGYGASEDYHTCYSESPVFGELTSPESMDDRYLHEDCGLGLVTYVSLGEMLGVDTRVSRSLLELARVVTGRDYLQEGRRTVEKLGIAAMDREALTAFLHEPRRC